MKGYGVVNFHNHDCQTIDKCFFCTYNNPVTEIGSTTTKKTVGTSDLEPTLHYLRKQCNTHPSDFSNDGSAYNIFLAIQSLYLLHVQTYLKQLERHLLICNF